VKQFNFKKTVMRNDFTRIFGGIGKRRLVTSYMMRKTGRIALYISGIYGIRWGHIPFGKSKRSKIQMSRRAHQGWRNELLGRIHALKIRLQYSRKKTTSLFRKNT